MLYELSSRTQKNDWSKNKGTTKTKDEEQQKNYRPHRISRKHQQQRNQQQQDDPPVIRMTNKAVTKTTLTTGSTGSSSSCRLLEDQPRVIGISSSIVCDEVGVLGAEEGGFRTSGSSRSNRRLENSSLGSSCTAQDNNGDAPFCHHGRNNPQSGFAEKRMVNECQQESLIATTSKGSSKSGRRHRQHEIAVASGRFIVDRRQRGQRILQLESCRTRTNSMRTMAPLRFILLVVLLNISIQTTTFLFVVGQPTSGPPSSSSKPTLTAPPTPNSTTTTSSPTPFSPLPAPVIQIVPTEAPVAPASAPQATPPSPSSSPVQPSSTSNPIPIPPQNENPITSSSSGPTSSPIKVPLPPTIPPTRGFTFPPTFPPTKTPTISPTRSRQPTKRPTASPTTAPTTPAPTKFPTREPTPNPTPNPTEEPTASPTFTIASINSQSYRQEFGSDDTLNLMSDEQLFVFQETLQGYTIDYGGTGSQFVQTTATVFNQAQLGVNNTRLAVDYIIEWESNKTDVNGTVPYSFKFLSWMMTPENSEKFVSDLQSGGIPVSRSNTIDVLNRPVPMPTPVTPPTIKPSFAPGQISTPTLPPSSNPSARLSQTMIIVIGVAAGLAALLSAATGFCLFFWCRNKKGAKTQILFDNPALDGGGGSSGNRSLTERHLEEAANSGGSTSIPVPPGIISSSDVASRDGGSAGLAAAMMLDGRRNHSVGASCDEPIVHSESLASQPSMLSGVKSVDSDLDDPDGTGAAGGLLSSGHLLDELDNNMGGNDKLEKMRAGVEDNVGGVDEMMSQALIKALTEDDDGTRDMRSLMWGGTGDGMEIEASVLCETNDWLKRKEGASLEERRTFMQDILNRMVATVRHNIIGPERGSRAIHGAAAMLGLQLAGDLPETALLVSGMRHRVQRKDLYSAFAEFGDIEGCAVAPNSKGFGLVRYNSPKAVQRALERYRTDKIDVQDVSVNVRVLTAPSSRMNTMTGPPPSGGGAGTGSNNDGGRGNSAAAASAAGYGRGGGVNGGGGGQMMGGGGGMLDTIDYPSDSLGRHGEVVRRQGGGGGGGQGRRQSDGPPANNNNMNGGGSRGGTSRIL